MEAAVLYALETSEGRRGIERKYDRSYIFDDGAKKFFVGGEHDFFVFSKVGAGFGGLGGELVNK